jgi:hypothetical protein
MGATNLLTAAFTAVVTFAATNIDDVVLHAATASTASRPRRTFDIALVGRTVTVTVNGVTVIATVSAAEKAARVRATGADHVVRYRTNLAALPDEGVSFSAIPPKIQGVGTFPVRAFARLG